MAKSRKKLSTDQQVTSSAVEMREEGEEGSCTGPGTHGKSWDKWGGGRWWGEDQRQSQVHRVWLGREWTLDSRARRALTQGPVLGVIDPSGSPSLKTLLPSRAEGACPGKPARTSSRG